MSSTYTPSRQVIEGLYDWLNIVAKPILDQNNLKTIKLETLDSKKSMALFAETGSYKDVINIIGDWECNFRFRVDFKSDGTSTKDILNLSQPINDLADLLEQETINGLSALNIGIGRMPVKIEMITLTSKAAVNPDNMQIFSAYYNLNLIEKRNKQNG